MSERAGSRTRGGGRQVLDLELAQVIGRSAGPEQSQSLGSPQDDRRYIISFFYSTYSLSLIEIVPAASLTSNLAFL